MVAGTSNQTSHSGCDAVGGAVGTVEVKLQGNCVVSVEFTALVPGFWMKDTRV
jgi:hypothetical protein